MKAVTLNKPALWRPIRSSEISVRKYGGGYPHESEDGTLARSTAREPVVRYAKNFEKFGLKFSLFIFSDNTDADAVEDYLASVAKDVKKKDINEVLAAASMSNFKYLDTRYEGDK